MNMNEWAKEIHQNAVEHGWWEEERSFGDIIALCHSELSEALEEYRNGWYSNKEIYVITNTQPICSRPFNTETDSKLKPEGVPTELADCMIRILDYLGKMDCPVNAWMKQQYINLKYKTFGDFIAVCHKYLSKSFEKESYPEMIKVIKMIIEYCRKEDIDIEEAIRIKHEYNKTRPFRHGGKVI